MEGKVIDLQTGKGIPNAKLVVYESVATKGSSKSNYFQLKTFYADQDGNFNDKIKISFPDEEDESYESFFLKAEPDGYEKTEGRDYPISGTGILPWGYLRLTRVNKNMVLQCNPEFKLDLTLVDKEPLYFGSFKELYIVSGNNGFTYLQPNGESSFRRFNNILLEQNLIMPSGELIILIRGFNQAINPSTTETLLRTYLSLNKNIQLTLEY
ncbi:MAG: hypothetical protein ACK5AQ_02405 [Bacteroidota bacterium]